MGLQSEETHWAVLLGFTADYQWALKFSNELKN